MTGIVQALLAGYGAVSAAASDAYFYLTTLLLPGNGTNGAQNNTFLDSSTNNFTITRNGNTTQGTFTPFSQTGWSNFASAASGSVGFSNSTAALVSSTTSTFTAECWIYMTEAPVSGDGVPALIGMDATFNSSIFLGFGPNASRNLVLRWFDGSSKTATGSTALALNTWHHIAVVANSNALAMYVNGVAETLSGTTTLTNRNSTTNTFSLFLNSSTSNYQFRGYASNIRVCTSAVYTGAFTPSTSPLTTTSQGATNCKLLTAQDNRFIDNSSNAYALTVQGSPSVQAFEPFAPGVAYSAATVGGSGYFDGAGDNLVTPTIGTTIGTGDYCLECFVYTPSASAAFTELIRFNNSAGYPIYLQVNANAVRFLDFQNPGTNFIITGGTINSNEWVHVVGLRQSGTVRAFVNGKLAAFQNGITFNYGTAGTAQFLNATAAAYMCDFRITIGSVPTSYQTTSTTIGAQIFTPPTSPVTTTSQGASGTALLLNFTNAGITDATAKNVLETIGNAQISTTQSKFGGSSMYFDGTGDRLVIPSSQNLSLGTGDFTIECWAYFNSLAANMPIICFGDDQTATGLLFYVNTSGRIATFGNGAVIAAGTTQTVTTGSWFHLAVSRSGTSLRLFVNGTNDGTATNSTSFSSSVIVGAELFIGAIGAQLNGYIDDLRVTKFARYTSNFTAPTAAFPLQ